MDTIPTVHRIGFEASNGFDTSHIMLIADVSYGGKTRTVEIEANLNKPAQLPAAVTKGIVDAFG